MSANFAGLVASARIATCWCSACVDSRGGYVGAFVGKATTGICLLDLDPVPDHMFFKYKVILEDE